jgi:actin-related protein
MALIVDLGCGFCKAGFSTDEKPQYVFPTIVAHYPVSRETRYVGRKASERICKPIHLTCKRPLQNGRVVDWDGIEDLLKHLYEDVIATRPDDHAIFLTNFRNIEAVGNAAEKITELLFEKFNVPAVYIPPSSASLCLHALGKTEGLVIELGEGINYITPHFDGHELPKRTSVVSGGEITEFLAHLLNLKGHSFYTSYDLDLIHKLKESHAGVSINMEEDELLLSEPDNQPEYTFCDGRKIKLGEEILKCTEILFEPHGFGSFGYDVKGIHELAAECITELPTQEIHDVLSSNIILCGGTAMLPGLKERLEADILPRVAAFEGTKIITPVNRDHLAWCGGAFYASRDDFHEVCATREKYDEIGPACVANCK